MTDELTLRDTTREKRNVALLSAVATIMLTIMKLVVGFLTGSLGLIAGAADSAIDLIASVLTLGAVQIADWPADESHPYGHGKVEYLSALTEMLLLLLASGWIVYASLQRIFFKPVRVEASGWAFAVMLTSLIVDAKRSQVMFRTAKELQSQALEADALNFRMDMFTSAVVILGLLLVRLSDFVGYRDILSNADAVAALGVAGFIVWAGVRMARQSVDALMDHAPVDLSRELRRAAQEVPGVLTCSPVRTRQVGPKVFVDLSVAVTRSASFEEAHAIVSAVESKLCEIVSGADVIVHADPVTNPTETVVHDIQAIAHRHGLSVHHISVQEVDRRLTAKLHVEVDHHLSLRKAHQIAAHLESAIRADLPQLATVNTHIEPAMLHISKGKEVTDAYPNLVHTIQETIAEASGSDDRGKVVLQQGDFGLVATIQCSFPGSKSVEDVHVEMSKLERKLRRQIPALDQVFIDPEVSLLS